VAIYHTEFDLNWPYIFGVVTYEQAYGC